MNRSMNSWRKLAALSLVVLFGCNGAAASERLSNSYDSPRSLARAVLKGLEIRDTAALREMRVTREEHEMLLWDALPESQDIPFAMAWDWNQRNSRKALRRALERYGGERWELFDIEFTEPAEVYPDFTLHRGARLRVRRLRDGRTGELKVLDVVLERDDRWKPLNYKE